jgi:hypothetical protein
MHQYLCLFIKLLGIEKLCALNNHRSSNLTDGPACPVADALQVRKHLFWNLNVDTSGMSLGSSRKRLTSLLSSTIG